MQEIPISISAVERDTVVPEKKLRMETTRSFSRFEIWALAAVVLIGLVRLPQPFQDDQAFFTIGAWKITHGALLYRDFWDIKQPGIFWFYAIAGKLFGFDEIGIHAFETLYMTVFAVVLIMTLSKYFERRWMRGVLVLLTVGFYYGVCGIPHATQNYLTQVEGLVGFPMFLCVWLASEASQHQHRKWTYLFISGLVGAVVLLLKFMFLPMLVCFWIAAFIFSRPWTTGNVLGSAIRFAVPIVLGLLGPILLVCAYFGHYGGLDLLYRTTFVWPVRAIHLLPLAGSGRLHESLQFFIDGFAPLLALAFVGAWWQLRTRSDILTINLLLWIITGTVVILLQRRSWWPYHFLLLSVPIGILGSKGVEYLWEQLHLGASRVAGRRAMVLALSLALFFSPVIYPILIDTLLLTRYRFAISKQQRLQYQCRYPNSQYPEVLAETGFLSNHDSFPGAIYVGGSPLFYLLSGRKPALTLCYGVDDFLPEQWADFSTQLTAARPPYVFLLPSFREWVKARSPQAIEFIEDNYRVLRTTDAGTWYVVNRSY